MTTMRVPPRILIRASDAVSRAQMGGSLELVGIVLVVLGELGADIDTEMLDAITIRLEALSRLFVEDVASGWLFATAGYECMLVSHAVLDVASRAEVRMCGTEARFDPTEFHALVLSATDIDGSA